LYRTLIAGEDSDFPSHEVRWHSPRIAIAIASSSALYGSCSVLGPSVTANITGCPAVDSALHQVGVEEEEKDRREWRH
jgi:hypothetical protein